MRHLVSQRLSAESLVALLLTAFAAAEFYGSLRLPMSEDFTLGAGALPAIYAVGLFIFSAALLVSSQRKSRPGAPAANPAEAAEAGGECADVRAGLLTSALLALFVGTIYVAGFMVALITFCFLFCLLISKLGPARSAVFALIWGSAVHAAFVYLLQVPLERGLLFS